MKTVNPVSVKYLWIKLRQKNINTQAATNYDLTLINHGPWFLKTNSYQKIPCTFLKQLIWWQLHTGCRTTIIRMCIFIIDAQLLSVAWTRGLPRKFTYVLYCHTKLAFLWTFYVSGSCFRRRAVILVLDFFKAVGGATPYHWNLVSINEQAEKRPPVISCWIVLTSFSSKK